MSRRTKVLLASAVAALVVFVGIPWIYINVIREPAAESFLEEIASATTVATSDVVSATTLAETPAAETETLADPSGTWAVSTDSQVGYRVDEVLFGQNVTAVGRTNAVSGSVTIDGLVVTAAEFSVDMTTVKSDEPKRDAQFESRIMDVINFPTSTFVLSTPITLDESNLSGNTNHRASGTLTLRGSSKQVDVDLVSSVRGGRITIAGEVVIIFEEWGIPNPSIPGISTEDSGILEFNIILER